MLYRMRLWESLVDGGGIKKRVRWVLNQPPSSKSNMLREGERRVEILRSRSSLATVRTAANQESSQIIPEHSHRRSRLYPLRRVKRIAHNVFMQVCEPAWGVFYQTPTARVGERGTAITLIASSPPEPPRTSLELPPFSVRRRERRSARVSSIIKYMRRARLTLTPRDQPGGKRLPLLLNVSLDISLLPGRSTSSGTASIRLAVRPPITVFL